MSDGRENLAPDLAGMLNHVQYHKKDTVWPEKEPTGTLLLVKTKNSTYRVRTTGDKRNCFMSGGVAGDEEVRVKIHGCTCGGSAIAVDRVILGMRMEFSMPYSADWAHLPETKSWTTTRIAEISREQ